MLPAAFVAVEQFAVNRNGKLDTAALPKPDLSAAAVGEEEDGRGAGGAESEAEASVRAVVEAVCGVSGVRRGTELLAIGVDSLKAMQLAARLAQELGAAVSVADVLECSTVADLVSLAGKGKNAERLPTWPNDLPALAAPYQVRRDVIHRGDVAAGRALVFSARGDVAAHAAAGAVQSCLTQ